MMSCLSLTAFKTLSFSLALNSLIMMYLGVNPFEFTLLGDCIFEPLECVNQ